MPNQNQGHRKKKPTKKESIQMVIDNFELEMKKYHIKGLVQGGEILAQTILDFIQDGKDLDYIKGYCESTLKSSQDGTMEKVVSKEKDIKDIKGE